ncbi:hypothetical protein DPMN_153586 [Dreissena polymorpha]|uniref:Uncharacterized protein n=1 Tax=Dreissena polymorpha TaxID=45954 RepID=A0A9D4FKE6_DREPO|nr:hypothetical protein DPMN_153586 [Dreissena polymorpha]
MFQAIDKAVQLLGAEQPHGPLLLSWAVIRQLFIEGGGGQLTKKYGNQALQLNVFDFILDMLSQEPFCGKSVRKLWSYLIYIFLICKITFW